MSVVLGDRELDVYPAGSIIETFAVFGGLRLHSLARICDYRCARCGHDRESTVIASTAEQMPICPCCCAASLHS